MRENRKAKKVTVHIGKATVDCKNKTAALDLCWEEAEKMCLADPYLDIKDLRSWVVQGLGFGVCIEGSEWRFWPHCLDG